MKFSEHTLTTLKSFSKINSGIKFYPGNIIRTKSPNSTLFAKAKVEDEIEGEFCIYDLSRFLGVYSLFNDPEIKLRENDLVIFDNNKSVVYRYASENVIEFSPNQDVNFTPTKMVKFTLTQDHIQNIVKACGILQLPEVSFTGEGGWIIAKTVDSKDKNGANVFGINIAESEENFNAVFKVEYLSSMFGGTYEVSIGLLKDKKGNEKVIAEFSNENYSYWIAAEISSKF